MSINTKLLHGGRLVEGSLYAERFAALSHVWRDVKQIRDPINTTNRGISLCTTEGKLSAIYELVSGGGLATWVDFLAIDQESHEDKSAQVELMPRIYGEAYLVYILLDQDDVRNILDYVDLIRSASAIISSGSAGDKVGWDVNSVARQVSMLDGEYSKGYFGRAWTMQELALSRARKYFVLRSDSAEALDMDGVINDAASHYAKIEHAYKYSVVGTVLHNALGFLVNQLVSNPLFSVVRAARFIGASGSPRDSMMYALTEGSRVCSRPHDVIYSRAALMGYPYKVDYSMPFVDLLAQARNWLTAENVVATVITPGSGWRVSLGDEPCWYNPRRNRGSHTEGEDGFRLNMLVRGDHVRRGFENMGYKIVDRKLVARGLSLVGSITSVGGGRVTLSDGAMLTITKHPHYEIHSIRSERWQADSLAVHDLKPGHAIYISHDSLFITSGQGDHLITAGPLTEYIVAGSCVKETGTHVFNLAMATPIMRKRVLRKWGIAARSCASDTEVVDAVVYGRVTVSGEIKPIFAERLSVEAADSLLLKVGLPKLCLSERARNVGSVRAKEISTLVVQNFSNYGDQMEMIAAMLCALADVVCSRSRIKACSTTSEEKHVTEADSGMDMNGIGSVNSRVIVIGPSLRWDTVEELRWAVTVKRSIDPGIVV